MTVVNCESSSYDPSQEVDAVATETLVGMVVTIISVAFLIVYCR